MSHMMMAKYHYLPNAMILGLFSSIRIPFELTPHTPWMNAKRAPSKLQKNTVTDALENSFPARRGPWA